MNTEQQQRLRQIREKAKFGDATPNDVDFLLSIVKSQEASGNLSHCALCEDPNFIYRDCALGAATAMRSACVEKVDERRRWLIALYQRIFTMRATGDPKHPLQAVIDYDARAEFEQELESLTLQEQEVNK